MSRSTIGARPKKKLAPATSEWLRGERHGARDCAEMRQKHGHAIAEHGLRDLSLNVRRGEDVEDFDRGYLRGYEAALSASPEVLQELARPLTPEEIKRDIAEALARRSARARGR